jgi:hypothetical protein
MTIQQAPTVSSPTVGDAITQAVETRPPLPPCTLETAIQRVREDGDTIADLMRTFLRKHVQR